MRIGAKKKPFYRVVVVDERAKRTGAYIELLGTYNPLTEPKDIKLKQDRIDYWIKQGAKLSTGYLRIIGKAPQRPPRKPKKEKKTEEPVKTEATLANTSDGGAEGDSSEVNKAEETIQKDSENSDSQNVGGSDQSDTPSPSESSENESESK